MIMQWTSSVNLVKNKTPDLKNTYKKNNKLINSTEQDMCIVSVSLRWFSSFMHIFLFKIEAFKVALNVNRGWGIFRKFIFLQLDVILFIALQNYGWKYANLFLAK